MDSNQIERERRGTDGKAPYESERTPPLRSPDFPEFVPEFVPSNQPIAVTMKEPFDQATLMQHLRYEPSTGRFVWVACEWRSDIVGSEAGCVSTKGYRVIKILNSSIGAHRLAFLYMTGRWPKGVIDHIDGDPLNNRWGNLREVSRVINGQNRRRARANTSTGVLGASYDKASGKFTSKISVNGRSVFLGYHPTSEAAHAAYLAAKRIHHEGNTL